MINENNMAYAYIVANKEEDMERYVGSYLKRKLEIAHSHFDDDNILKTIMELINAKRNKKEEIIKFFDSSFWNYQDNPNIEDIITFSINWLIDMGFIKEETDGRYYLTPNLGKVTLNFLGKSFNHYELQIFKEIEEHIKEKGLKSTFPLIDKITKILEIEIYNKGNRKNKEILEFFSIKYLVPEHLVKNTEYASYIIWHAWIENKTIKEIEEKYNVYADSMKFVSKQIYNGMELMEEMYKANRKRPSKEFEDLKIRVRKGVRQKEVCIAKQKNYGREYCKDLYKTALEIISIEKGSLMLGRKLPYPSLMEFYKKIYKKYGREKLKNKLIEISKHFKKKRADEFINLIENEMKSEVSP